MIRTAVVGLGKMGISHLSLINAHPDVNLVAACDTTKYLLDVIRKYTGLETYSSYERMLDEIKIDALILATPSSSHFDMVRVALDRGIHVFCEKPFTLDPDQADELAKAAQSKGLVNQVGYHYRFVGAFREVKRLLDAGAIGTISHALAEAYGPVVLRSKGSTWRTQRQAGGGCLYDYAAHPINLLNWYFGMPDAVGGTLLNKIFSSDTDDEVCSTLYFGSPSGRLSAQLSVNWCDESQRKMTTKMTIWGSNGRIYADRQEVQVYLRKTLPALPDYQQRWNVRYTTELTDPVWFYLRGEEYSAQLDYFVKSIEEGRRENINSFSAASQTDRVITMLIADHEAGPRQARNAETVASPAKRKRALFGRSE